MGLVSSTLFSRQIFFLLKFFFCLFFIQTALFGQILNISNYDIENGLNNSIVSSIFQDSKGFLYVGTKNGVCRYDGYYFTTVNNRLRFNQNYVTGFVEDKRGKIYYSTLNGVYRYAGDTSYMINGLPPTCNFAFRFLHVINDTLWAGSNEGLHCFKNEIMVANYSFGSTDLNNLSCFLKEGNDFYLGTKNGLIKFNALSRTHFPILFGKNDNPSSKLGILSICRDAEGTIWVGTTQGLYYVSNGLLVKHKASEFLTSEIWHLAYNPKMGLYLATDNGIVTIHEGKIGSITRENGLSDNSIRYLLFDISGNLWFGTLNDGIGLLKPSYFVRYVPKDQFNRNFRSLNLSSKQIIAGNNTGELFELKNDKLELLITKGDKINKAITTILYDSVNKEYVIGTYGQGLFILKNNILKMAVNDAIPNDSKIYSGMIDSEGKICLSTHGNGLIILSKKECTIYGKKNGLETDIIRYVVEDKRKNLIIITSEGVFILGKDGFQKLNFKENNLNILSCCLSDNEIFFGGSSSVWKYNYSELKKMQISADYIFPVNGMAYEKNKLILVGNGGLTVLSKEGQEINHFGYEDGSKNITFQTNSIHNHQENQFYIRTAHGLVKFDYSISSNINKVAKLYITNIYESGEKLYDIHQKGKILPDDTVLVLPHNQNNLKVSFVVLGLFNKSLVDYRYQLIGFDKKIQESGSVHDLVFSNLTPGKYTLQLYAKLGKTNFQTLEKKIQIQIKHPFWEEWWFYGIQIGTLLALFFCSIYLKTKRLFIRFSSVIMMLIIIAITEALVIYCESYVDQFVVGIPVLKLVSNMLLALLFMPIEKIAYKIYHRI